MFDTAEWTVVALKRYLKDHKQNTTGLKEVLRQRCVKHSTKCKCTSLVNSAVELTPAPEKLSYLNELLDTITWTDSLHDVPPIGHPSIALYKASDKHIRQGYILFKNDKVENMLVGRDEGGDFYCKGRVSPSMKKHRYITSVQIRGTTVSDSDCSCPAGKGKCKHAIALLYALTDLIMLESKKIPESVACTSQPRQWGRITCKPVVSSVENFSELALKTVCHDPDNPEAAIIQKDRVEKQLQYSSLPDGIASLPDQTRHKILTAHHPFWRTIIDNTSTSCLQVTPHV